MRILVDVPHREPKGRHLKNLVLEFTRKFPKLKTQQGAYNKCKFVSYECVLFLRRRGFKARLIHIQNCPAPMYPNAHSKWISKRRDKWSHYVVGIGKWSIDLTARQFDVTLPVPFVQPMSKLREQWTSVEDDRFLNNWVAEVLRHKDMV
jgi:hypothetical protein